MLNAKKFKEITKEEILKKYSELELFSYYISNFKGVGKRFSSELRKDNNPSCVIYQNGIYIDFATGERYDIFSYLQYKYSCSFIEALNIINNDLNLKLGKKMDVEPVFLGLKKPLAKIEYKQIEYTQKILDYFNKGNITKDILQQYNVVQISDYWVNDKKFSVPLKNPGVILKEINKGKWVYKIYLPFNEKGKRFPVSNDGGSIYGLRQLDSFGEFVVITSSKKDIMTLRSIGLNSISGTSESVLFSTQLIDYLKTRFKEIYVLYDYDKAGIDRANYLKDLYNLDKLIFTNNVDYKDPFDYCVKFGPDKLKKLILK